MGGNRPLSKAASWVPWRPFSTLRNGLYSYDGRSASACVIDKISISIAILQILIAIRG
jgi:hypothetical protein